MQRRPDHAARRPTFHADLIVGFKVFQERFASRVTLHPHALIDVEYINGPFRYLNNHWFIEAEDGGRVIDFYVDFEFKSRCCRS